jgi:hypothetical protein
MYAAMWCISLHGHCMEKMVCQVFSDMIPVCVY